MSLFRISNGTIDGPANNLNGVVQDLYGKMLHVLPEFDAGVVPDVKKWFESFYTIQFANYPVDESYMAHGGRTIECRKS